MDMEAFRYPDCFKGICTDCTMSVAERMDFNVLSKLIHFSVTANSKQLIGVVLVLLSCMDNTSTTNFSQQYRSSLVIQKSTTEDKRYLSLLHSKAQSRGNMDASFLQVLSHQNRLEAKTSYVSSLSHDILDTLLSQCIASETPIGVQTASFLFHQSLHSLERFSLTDLDQVCREIKVKQVDGHDGEEKLLLKMHLLKCYLTAVRMTQVEGT